MLKQNLLSLSHNSLRTSPVFRLFLHILETRILAIIAVFMVMGALYLAADRITSTTAFINFMPIGDVHNEKEKVK